MSNYNHDRNMSIRACLAYDYFNEKKITDFGKADRDELLKVLRDAGYQASNITVPQMRRWLKDQGESSWHHTGRSYRKTSFYSTEFALTGMLGTFNIEDILEESVGALLAA